jgi:hypothetical protein
MKRRWIISNQKMKKRAANQLEFTVIPQPVLFPVKISFAPDRIGSGMGYGTVHCCRGGGCGCIYAFSGQSNGASGKIYPHNQKDRPPAFEPINLI